MTYDDFVNQLVAKLQAAEKKPMQDLPAIDAAIVWAMQVIGNSSQWTPKHVEGFLDDVGRRLGAIDEIDPRTRQRIKRAQSNTAFMALMAKADQLAAAAKGGK